KIKELDKLLKKGHVRGHDWGHIGTRLKEHEHWRKNELINLLASVIKSAIIAKVKEAKGTKKGQGYDNGSTKETFGYKSKSLLFSLWFLVRWNILKENIKGLTLKWLKLIRSRKIKRKRQFDECVDDPSI
ncbi:hypothetical protein ACJX0J_016198, partial [Zea mays]